jgi:phage-related protein
MGHWLAMKAAIFHPAARSAIRLFPEGVRRELGKAVFDLQKGQFLAMPLSRPMPSVSPGVEELRIRDRDGIYRVFYYAKLARGVLVFHAFEKKTRATPKREIQLGKKRLQEMLYEKI